MIRTAISPRLAIKTLLSTKRQSGRHDPRRANCAEAGRGHPFLRYSPVRPDRLDQPLSARRGPRRCGPKAPSPWPPTRPPGGADAAGSGRRRRTPRCWHRSCCDRPSWRPHRRHLVTAAVALAAASACEAVAGFRPRSEVAERPAGGGPQAGRDPGRGRRGRDRRRPRHEPQLGRRGAPAGGGARPTPWPGGRSTRARCWRPCSTDLEDRCRQLDRTDGLLASPRTPGPASATIGRDVRVELVDQTVVGRAEGIDDHGHLHVAHRRWRRPAR